MHYIRPTRGGTFVVCPRNTPTIFEAVSVQNSIWAHPPLARWTERNYVRVLGERVQRYSPVWKGSCLWALAWLCSTRCLPAGLFSEIQGSSAQTGYFSAQSHSGPRMGKERTKTLHWRIPGAGSSCPDRQIFCWHCGVVILQSVVTTILPPFLWVRKESFHQKKQGNMTEFEPMLLSRMRQPGAVWEKNNRF